MTQTVLLILGIIIVVILLTQRGRAGMKGICAAVVGVDAKKREQKEKILALFAGAKDKSLGLRPLPLAKGEKLRGELSNADIRNALGISERSVVRYMDELEYEGKVEQVGPTGRNVTYRLR